MIAQLFPWWGFYRTNMVIRDGLSMRERVLRDLDRLDEGRPTALMGRSYWEGIERLYSDVNAAEQREQRQRLLQTEKNQQLIVTKKMVMKKKVLTKNLLIKNLLNQKNNQLN